MEVFKRYELKFILTERQRASLLRAAEGHMELDKYGRTTIRSIYYDTDSDLLVRRSLERPVYKEKLRLRSYGPAAPTDDVFVELKKKYDGVVYKRRVSMHQDRATVWLSGGAFFGEMSQIQREIGYFRDFYKTLQPKMFLSYQREAYYDPSGGPFRMTLDDTILARREDLDLGQPVWGEAVLPKGKVLLEVKTPGAIPLWLTDFLTREKVYKTSFSKYGAAYLQMLTKQGGQKYA